MSLNMHYGHKTEMMRLRSSGCALESKNEMLGDFTSRLLSLFISLKFSIIILTSVTFPHPLDFLFHNILTQFTFLPGPETPGVHSCSTLCP